MVANLKSNSKIESRIEFLIEDMGNHPTEMVTTLRSLLAGGAEIVPDPKRADFYEVESDAMVYYIHIFPITGKILLLAAWPNEAALTAEERAA